MARLLDWKILTLRTKIIRKHLLGTISLQEAEKLAAVNQFFSQNLDNVSIIFLPNTYLKYTNIILQLPLSYLYITRYFIQLLMFTGWLSNKVYRGDIDWLFFSSQWIPRGSAWVCKEQPFIAWSMYHLTKNVNCYSN